MQNHSVFTTKLSSKGQVVIPEQIRNAMGLKQGVQFVVLSKEDTLVLKTIEEPRINQFSSLIAEAKKVAKAGPIKKIKSKRAKKEPKSRK